MFHSLSTTQFLHPDPSSILLASSNPSSAKNFLHALLNNLSLSPLFRCVLSFPLGVPLFRDSARVGAPQEIPLRGKTSFFFRTRRRDKYSPPPRGKPRLKIFCPAGKGHASAGAARPPSEIRHFRSGQLARRLVLLRLGPSRSGPAGTIPQGESSTGRPAPGRPTQGKPSQGTPHLGGPHGASRTLCGGN